MIDATEIKIRVECPLENPSPEAKNMHIMVITYSKKIRVEWLTER